MGTFQDVATSALSALGIQSVPDAKQDMSKPATINEYLESLPNRVNMTSRLQKWMLYKAFYNSAMASKYMNSEVLEYLRKVINDTKPLFEVVYKGHVMLVPVTTQEYDQGKIHDTPPVDIHTDEVQTAVAIMALQPDNTSEKDRLEQEEEEARRVAEEKEKTKKATEEQEKARIAAEEAKAAKEREEEAKKVAAEAKAAQEREKEEARKAVAKAKAAQEREEEARKAAAEEKRSAVLKRIEALKDDIEKIDVTPQSTSSESLLNAINIRIEAILIEIDNTYPNDEELKSAIDSVKQNLNDKETSIKQSYKNQVENFIPTLQKILVDIFANINNYLNKFTFRPLLYSVNGENDNTIIAKADLINNLKETLIKSGWDEVTEFDKSTVSGTSVCNEGTSKIVVKMLYEALGKKQINNPPLHQNAEEIIARFVCDKIINTMLGFLGKLVPEDKKDEFNTMQDMFSNIIDKKLTLLLEKSHTDADPNPFAPTINVPEQAVTLVNKVMSFYTHNIESNTIELINKFTIGVIESFWEKQLDAVLPEKLTDIKSNILSYLKHKTTNDHKYNKMYLKTVNNLAAIKAGTIYSSQSFDHLLTSINNTVTKKINQLAYKTFTSLVNNHAETYETNKVKLTESLKNAIDVVYANNIVSNTDDKYDVNTEPALQSEHPLTMRFLNHFVKQSKKSKNDTQQPFNFIGHFTSIKNTLEKIQSDQEINRTRRQGWKN